jgi:hypothetical protein
LAAMAAVATSWTEVSQQVLFRTVTLASSQAVERFLASLVSHIRFNEVTQRRITRPLQERVRHVILTLIGFEFDPYALFDVFSMVLPLLQHLNTIAFRNTKVVSSGGFEHFARRVGPLAGLTLRCVRLAVCGSCIQPHHKADVCRRRTAFFHTTMRPMAQCGTTFSSPSRALRRYPSSWGHILPGMTMGRRRTWHLCVVFDDLDRPSDAWKFGMGEI